MLRLNFHGKNACTTLEEKKYNERKEKKTLAIKWKWVPMKKEKAKRANEEHENPGKHKEIRGKTFELNWTEKKWKPFFVVCCGSARARISLKRDEIMATRWTRRTTKTTNTRNQRVYSSINEPKEKARADRRPKCRVKEKGAKLMIFKWILTEWAMLCGSEFSFHCKNPIFLIFIYTQTKRVRGRKRKREREKICTFTTRRISFCSLHIVATHLLLTKNFSFFKL